MAVLLGRRAALLGVASALACSRAESSAGGGPPPLPVSPNVRLLQWDLGAQPWGPGRAAVVVPTWGAPDARFPVVVALHGRGESVKAPIEAALGWPRDYALVRAFDRLRAPPLRDADYEGLAVPARMAETNAALARQPFGGLIVVCPWLPDVRPAATGDISAYARFILDVVLPRVRRDTPAISTPEATGIDGVSLGGILALRIGLTSPGSFGAVSGIQAAFSEGQGTDWVTLAESARAVRPDLKLRLLTSHDDYFHDAVVEVSRAWDAAAIAHDFADVIGPHDYIFNRGPGSIELLFWNDRALRGVGAGGGASGAEGPGVAVGPDAAGGTPSGAASSNAAGSGPGGVGGGGTGRAGMGGSGVSRGGVSGGGGTGANGAGPPGAEVEAGAGAGARAGAGRRGGDGR